MRIYNFTSEKIEKQTLRLNWYNKSEKYFIICSGDEITDLQDVFNFAQETIEGCMKIDDLVRMESYDEYDFINLNYFYFLDGELEFESINLYIGENYIVLVLSSDSRLRIGLQYMVLQRVEKLQKIESRLNRAYYLIFDKLLANLFMTLEEVEGRIEILEDFIIQEANQEHLAKIHNYRLIVTTMKKNLRPLLYIGDQLLVNENEFIAKDYQRHFKNIDIRLNKLYDFINDLSEMINQLQYLYDSTLSTERNKISERLTIITTFLAPLTVITGVYGMNFTNMPELKWQYGYPIAIGIMLVVSLGLFIFMKRNDWL